MKRRNLFGVLAVLTATTGVFARADITSDTRSDSSTGKSTNAVSFRIGPGHSGVARFSSVSLPSSPLWQVNVGGTPSYALIADGMVFVTVEVTGNTHLIALDRTTGKVVWGPIVLSGQSNAAYEHGILFVFSTDGLMQAFGGSTGRPLWAVTLSSPDISSSGPTAMNGIVFTGADGGMMYALDERTGTLLWTHPVIGGEDSTPAVSDNGVYVAYPCWTYDLAPTSGASNWTNTTGCDGGGGGTPVLGGGRLYAPNGFGTYNGDIFNATTGKLISSYVADNPPAIDSTMGYFLQSGTLRGLTTNNYSVVWSFVGDGSLVSSPIVVNRYVFVGSSSGNLYALESATGKQVWKVNVGAAIPPGAGWGAGLPLSGLSAGAGLLVVPAGSSLTAYELSSD